MTHPLSVWTSHTTGAAMVGLEDEHKVAGCWDFGPNPEKNGVLRFLLLNFVRRRVPPALAVCGRAWPCVVVCSHQLPCVRRVYVVCTSCAGVCTSCVRRAYVVCWRVCAVCTSCVRRVYVVCTYAALVALVTLVAFVALRALVDLVALVALVRLVAFGLSRV